MQTAYSWENKTYVLALFNDNKEPGPIILSGGKNITNVIQQNSNSKYIFGT